MAPSPVSTSCSPLTISKSQVWSPISHGVTSTNFHGVGVGDLTNINILTGDQGGEMDYHGAAGAGFPVGGLLFSSAFGQLQQMQEWTVALLPTLGNQSLTNSFRASSRMTCSASAHAYPLRSRRPYVSITTRSWAASGTCLAITPRVSLRAA